MKIVNQTLFTVVAKAEPTRSQDGRTMYYRLACLQNGQATNVSVSEDVYDAIPAGIVDGKFNTSYDDKYQSFRIDSIVEIISVNGVKPDAKTDSKPSGNTPVK